ncbi:MAG: hypothetical protein IJ643_01630 [Eubacterium sp.]|nr:hypothetical protein [Eubacterium sp.]
MKKNFEYKEPEFKVVIADCEDVLTASDPTPTGNLPVTTNDWVTPRFTL